MEWQDITSAPKDTTRILGFDPHQWGDEQVSTTYFTSGKWIFEAEIEAVGWEDYRHATWDPTHWMPLPMPPKPKD